MRLRSLLLLDMRFQARHSFYFMYGVMTIIYTVILFALPEGWRQSAAAVLIYSDPAAMGLFFMGAIILLEKSQHTPCAFAVSPVRAAEYVTAKVGSLSLISLVVAAALGLAAEVDRLWIVLLGTVLASVIFTLLGIIIAVRISSLNQFILWTVPMEILCFIPAVLHLFGITPTWLQYYPVNACIDIISGHVPSAAGFFSVIMLTAILSIVSGYCVLKMWDSIGGVKL